MALTFKQENFNTINTRLGVDKVQTYMAKTVADYLRDYVSYKSGTQEANTRVASDKEVVIDVPYAEYQAYSTRIKKMSGKRGTRPFERMVNDKSKTILSQLEAYSKKVGN